MAAEAEADAGLLGKTLLDGRFAIVRVLGRGGMGVVYEAFDHELGQGVAVKTLPQANADAILRFKREFRSMANVLHRNVAVLYELFAIGDLWFFTMERVDGVDFLAHVSASETYDEAKLRASLGQLALGIEALHDEGFVHCDIKPSNVMVDRQGRVVVLDFGLVSNHPLDEPTQRRGLTVPQATVAGTPVFMAPEQARGSPTSTASDWYAVGVMLFEALTGQLPFSGDPADVMNAKTRLDPPRPSDLVDGVADDLDELCIGLLSRDSATRLAGDAVRAVAGAVPASASRRTSERCFVGRQREKQVLARAFDDVRRTGRPQLVFVHGPSGVGKSALLSELPRIFGPRAHVFAGRCFEREFVPFKALDAVVDELGVHLRERNVAATAATSACTTLFPGLGDRWGLSVERPSPVTRSSAFSAMRELLRQVAHNEPVALLIDDAHWGDADSAQLLAHVLAPPDAPPMLVVVSFAEGDRGPFVSTMAERMTPTSDLTLGSLSAGDASRLIQSAGRGELSLAIVHDVLSASGGHPLHALELATAWRPAGGPRSLEDLFQRKLASLAPEERRILEIVSIAGSPIPLEVAAEAADMAVRPEHARALVQRRFARLGGLRGRDAITMTHAAIAAACLVRFTADERRQLHGQLARTLATHGARPHQLAYNFAAAGEHALAVRHALAAAGDAQRALAFAREAEMLHIAVAALEEAPGLCVELAEPLECADVRSGPPASILQQLRRRRATALSRAGRSAEAAEAWLAIAKGEPQLEALDIRRHAAELLFASGRLRRAEEVLAGVARRVGLNLPTSGGWGALRLIAGTTLILARRPWRNREQGADSRLERLQLRTCLSAGLGLSPTDPVRSGLYMLRATQIAGQLGACNEYARGLAYIGMMLTFGGGVLATRGLALIHEAEQLAEAGGHDDAAAFTAAARGIALAGAGEWPRALEELSAADARYAAGEQGASFERNIAATTRLLVLRQAGRLGDMRIEAERLHHAAEALGNRFTAVEAHTFAVYGALADDDVGFAEQHLAAMRDTWEPEAFVFQDWTALHHLLAMALYRGVSPTALGELERGERAARRSGLMATQVVRVEAAALETALCLELARLQPSNEGMMLKRASMAMARLRRERRPWVRVLVSFAEAGLAVRSRRVRRAQRKLREARQRAETCGMAVHAAMAAWCLATRFAEGQASGIEATLSNLGVRSPERWAHVCAAGV